MVTVRLLCLEGAGRTGLENQSNWFDSRLQAWLWRPRVGPDTRETFSHLPSPCSHTLLPGEREEHILALHVREEREREVYGLFLTLVTKSECLMMVLMKRRWSVAACPSAT